jgi:glycosyltransferase involved in cell wall biosynthesis
LETKLLYIGNQLALKGATVTSIETLGAFLNRAGFSVITSSKKKNKVVRLLDMLWTVIRYSKQVEIILIDTYSTQNFYYSVAVAQLCQLLERKYIPILRGGNLPERLDHSPYLSKRLFGGAYKNVAPSRYLLEAFQTAGYQNLCYIPNTIDLAKYTYLHRKTVRPKLLWVRAFARLYNPLLALHVLEGLLEQRMDASLCMVGPDKEGSLQECKAYAQAKNLPVSFTGKLEKDEWIALAASYDIFINTTNIDNTPVSVIEAMALGLPVVSTRVGGIPYLLEHERNALLVPAGDGQAFVEAILRLVNNPQVTASLSQRGRDTVAAFDWQRVKPLWLKLLHQ